MIERPITFKNAHPLYQAPGLHQLLRDLEEGRLNETLLLFRNKKIEEIHLIPDGSTPRKVTVALVDAMESLGFRTALLDRDAYLRPDYGAFQEEGQRVLRSVKRHPVLLLYSETETHIGLAFVSAVILTIPRLQLNPHQALKLVIGTAYRPESDDELRNPLPVLQGYVNYLKEHPPELVAHEHPPSAQPIPPGEKATPHPKEVTAPPLSQTGVADHPPSTPELLPGALRWQESQPLPVHEDLFRAGRYTIRLKLSTIISMIVLLSLGTMIFWATLVFKNHTATLIQEYNLSLAQQVGRRVDEEISNIMERTRVFTDTLEGDYLQGRRRNDFVDLFFAKNENILYYASGTMNGELPSFRDGYVSERLLNKTGILREDLRRALEDHASRFGRVIRGEVLVENVSPYFQRPVILVGLSSGERIAVVFLEASGLAGSFRSDSESSVFQVMLVNEEGTVLAHTSETQTLARANRIRVPIVETMLTSAVFSGSRRFEFEGKEYLGSYRLLSLGRMGVISMVEADEVFRAVYSIQRQNFWLTLIVLTLASVFTFLFSQTISGPIVRLVEATRLIEQGHYQVDIRPTTRDEIGILTNSFQNMARGLGERERIKDIFGKFVNQTIAEKALRGEISLGGEKKDAAIFFSDLRNFTGISENMEPAAVVEMLNRYFTAMVEKVYEYEGVVDKFIGDAIMAHWGALTPTGNDTKNAVEAALAMRHALMELNQEATRSGGPLLRFGIGINTGPVIAGQIGSNKKLEYTVIGDTVNLANRIEFLNKHFGTDILISSYSHKHVAGDYNFVEMPEIKIKGKIRPEVIFAVLGRKDDPTAPKSLEELRSILGIQYDESQARAAFASSVDTLTGNSRPGI